MASETSFGLNPTLSIPLPDTLPLANLILSSDLFINCLVVVGIMNSPILIVLLGYFVFFCGQVIKTSHSFNSSILSLMYLVIGL